MLSNTAQFSGSVWAWKAGARGGEQGNGNTPAETQGPGSLQLGWTRAGRLDVSDAGTEPEPVASHGGEGSTI